MTSDTEAQTTPMEDDTPIDDSPHVESSAQAARKVHWNLERGKSIQGAMDARTIHRKDEDDLDSKQLSADRRRARRKHSSSGTKRNRSFGHGQIDATNELDRMDEHEAREERLRRQRREETRRREEKREKMEMKREREREREVAVEDSEDSSLSEAGEVGTKMPTSGSKNAGTSFFFISWILANPTRL